MIELILFGPFGLAWSAMLEWMEEEKVLYRQLAIADEDGMSQWMAS